MYGELDRFDDPDITELITRKANEYRAITGSEINMGSFAPRQYENTSSEQLPF